MLWGKKRQSQLQSPALRLRLHRPDLYLPHRQWSRGLKYNAPKAKVYGQTSDVQSGPITRKITQGTRIAVTSKTVNVKIIGVEGDTLQAAATSEAGAEPLMTQVSGEASRPRILFYVPASTPRRARTINIEVKVPRYAEVESVESSTGEIDVSDMDAPVAISNGTGMVKVNRVGSLKINTRGGEIIAREIKGDLIARSTHGDMTIENVTRRCGRGCYERDCRSAQRRRRRASQYGNGRH